MPTRARTDPAAAPQPTRSGDPVPQRRVGDRARAPGTTSPPAAGARPRRGRDRSHHGPHVRLAARGRDRLDGVERPLARPRQPAQRLPGGPVEALAADAGPPPARARSARRAAPGGRPAARAARSTAPRRWPTSSPARPAPAAPAAPPAPRPGQRQRGRRQDASPPSTSSDLRRHVPDPVPERCPRPRPAPAVGRRLRGPPAAAAPPRRAPRRQGCGAGRRSSGTAHDGGSPVRVDGVGSNRTQPTPSKYSSGQACASSARIAHRSGLDLLPGQEADGHPGRDVEGARHQRHGRGELDAVAPPVLEERLDRVPVGDVGRVQGVLNPPVLRNHCCSASAWSYRVCAPARATTSWACSSTVSDMPGGSSVHRASRSSGGTCASVVGVRRDVVGGDRVPQALGGTRRARRR